MAKRLAPMDPFDGPGPDEQKALDPSKKAKIESGTPDIQTLNVASPPPPPPPTSLSSSSPSSSAQPLVQESRRREARKAEIIRRSVELDPPLTLLELEHMASFNASIKIAKDFTDQDWEFLRPRLLDELPKIQSTIKQNEAIIESIRTGQSEGIPNSHLNPASSASTLPQGSPIQGKQARDAAWTENQKPTRDSLEAIARAYILTEWDNGRAINYYNVPRFAAQALMYTRDTFLRQHSDSRANRPRLVLDDMKWVYDTVLKQYTEHYRKDIFDCRCCEFGSKPLEACIQHFAHKHTNSFSIGASGVAWCEAEWPKDPPFNPNPQQFPIGTSAGLFPHSLTPTPYVSTYYPPPQSTPTPGQYQTHGYVPTQMYPPPSYITSPVQSGMSAYPPYAGGSPVHAQQLSQQGSPAQQYGWPNPPQRMTSISPAMISQGYDIQYPVPRQIPAAPTIPNGQQLPTYNPQASTNFQDSGIDELGGFMSHAWMILSKLGLIGLDDSIVVFAVMYHGMSEFLTRYKVFPSLEMFMASLDRSAQLLSFKRKDKIACKACTKISGVGSDEPQISRKLYNVTSLLQHFKNIHQSPPKHISSNSGHGGKEDPITVDWKVDMIDLPDPSQIARFASEHELGQPQLDLFADAFPDALSDYVRRRSQNRTGEYDPRNPGILTDSTSFQKQPNPVHADKHAYLNTAAAADQFLNELETTQESRQGSTYLPQASQKTPLPRDNSHEQSRNSNSRKGPSGYQGTHTALWPSSAQRNGGNSYNSWNRTDSRRWKSNP